jgi:hypothetical protein
MVLRRLDRPLVLVPSYASIERGVAGNIVQLATRNEASVSRFGRKRRQ